MLEGKGPIRTVDASAYRAAVVNSALTMVGSIEAFLSATKKVGLWKATQAGRVLLMTRSHSVMSSGVSLLFNDIMSVSGPMTHLIPYGNSVGMVIRSLWSRGAHPLGGLRLPEGQEEGPCARGWVRRDRRKN